MDDLWSNSRGVLGELRGSKIGGIEHAIISIVDNREQEIEEEENETEDSNSVFSKAKKLAKKLDGVIDNKALLDKINSKLDSAEQYAKGAEALWKNALRTTAYDGDERSFEVQFNPKELQFSVSLTESHQKKDADGEHKQVEQMSKSSQVTLSVELYMDENDVLMSKKQTVQKRVEGLMAAVGNSLTRQMIFSWGNISYGGIATSINASYIMFDTKGNPIKAKIKLDMVCMGLTEADVVTKERPFGMWQEAYESFVKPEIKNASEPNMFRFNK